MELHGIVKRAELLPLVLGEAQSNVLVELECDGKTFVLPVKGRLYPFLQIGGWLHLILETGVVGETINLPVIEVETMHVSNKNATPSNAINSFEALLPVKEELPSTPPTPPELTEEQLKAAYEYPDSVPMERIKRAEVEVGLAAMSEAAYLKAAEAVLPRAPVQTTPPVAEMPPVVPPTLPPESETPAAEAVHEGAAEGATPSQETVETDSQVATESTEVASNEQATPPANNPFTQLKNDTTTDMTSVDDDEFEDEDDEEWGDD